MSEFVCLQTREVYTSAPAACGLIGGHFYRHCGELTRLSPACSTSKPPVLLMARISSTTYPCMRYTRPECKPIVNLYAAVAYPLTTGSTIAAMQYDGTGRRILKKVEGYNALWRLECDVPLLS